MFYKPHLMSALGWDNILRTCTLMGLVPWRPVLNLEMLQNVTWCERDSALYPFRGRRDYTGRLAVNTVAWAKPNEQTDGIKNCQSLCVSSACLLPGFPSL